MKNRITILVFILICINIKAQKMGNIAQTFPIDEATCRIVIRELIDSYGYYADRREPEKQAALYTENAIVEIYKGEPDKSEPIGIHKGRKELVTAFSTLKKYDLTYHFNGQNTIQFNENGATGRAYCIAHHVYEKNGRKTILIMGIHYYDTYAYENNQWLFAKRLLIIDWEEERPLEM